MDERGTNTVVTRTTALEPKTSNPTLSLSDAIGLIVGTVIGAGIFETPALVAANTNGSSTIVLLWIAGGVISFLGALCYAELTTAYPHVGGNYYYLKRAFGSSVAFLFAWARMTVMQTGSIALLAFVFGDYASQLFRLGSFSASIYAVLAIGLLTIFNLLGLRQGKRVQNWLTIGTVLGLLLIILLGLALATPTTPIPPASPSTTTLGLALVFVLLSYGGWNEAAYISAEVRNGERNMVRSLLWSIGIITVIYVLVNITYLRGLGLGNMAQSEAVAADLMRQIFGEPGAIFISLVVIVTVLSSLNGTLFTGARTNYALGQDFPLFRFLADWRQQPGTPTTAFLLQGAIALGLVVMGTLTRKGFETMVDYTAPVFWFFFLLSGLSLFIFRYREPHQRRPFRVPLYPYVPILFCIVCGYLLYSSLAYTGIGALVGVLVVAIGIPFLYWNQQQRTHS